MDDVTFFKRKQRIDELLIDPLTQAGMRRQARFKIADHELFLEQLRNRIAYLDADNLGVLAAIAEAAAAGKNKNIWPDLVSLTNWAHILQSPPDDDSRLVTSYMKSVAGQHAWGLGPEYALVLRRYLRKFRRPPNDFAWVQMRKDAADFVSRASRIREFMARGAASDESQRWLSGYERALEAVRRLVFPENEGVIHEPT